MQRLASSIILWLCLCLHGLAHACWDEAGSKHDVAPQLLYAMAQAESSLNPRAVNRTHIQRTGSYDVGQMQINSSNFRALAKRGISESDLYKPCTNIDVGASILAEKIARYGMTWEAVGAYNASCTQLSPEACRRARSDYAWRVYRFLQPLIQHARGGAPAGAQPQPRQRRPSSSPAPASPQYIFQESLS